MRAVHDGGEAEDGPVGAGFAEHFFGFDLGGGVVVAKAGAERVGGFDPEILGAVAVHANGRGKDEEGVWVLRLDGVDDGFCATEVDAFGELGELVGLWRDDGGEVDDDVLAVDEFVHEFLVANVAEDDAVFVAELAKFAVVFA